MKEFLLFVDFYGVIKYVNTDQNLCCSFASRSSDRSMSYSHEYDRAKKKRYSQVPMYVKTHVLI